MREKIKDNHAGDDDGEENRPENGYDDYLLVPSANHSEEMFPWKDEITENCRLWIENLQEMPNVSITKEEPDLYSFYEQLCILRSEFRKNSRRSHETFSQFGDHLQEFQVVLETLSQRLDILSQEQDSTEILARQKVLLQMVEIFERLRWFGKKLEEITTVPQQATEGFMLVFREGIKRLFAGSQKTRSGILDSVTEGFSLTLAHFEEFLAGEGIARIKATGTAFDPSVMIAVGTVETDACPPNTVWEEISGGYLYGENVLKLAKVIVTKRKDT
jgi:molecular chaperone GrpE